MIMIVILALAYTLSVITTYMLLRYHFITQMKLKWTRTDRTIGILFSVVPLVSLITLLIIVISNWDKSNLFWGQDEVKW